MQDRKENPKGQKPKRNWKPEVCELILQLFWMGSGRWQPQKTRDLDLHTGTGPKDEGCCLWKVGSWNWDPLCRVRTLKGIVALEKCELEKYLPTGIGRRQGSLSVLAWGWVKENVSSQIMCDLGQDLTQTYHPSGLRTGNFRPVIFWGKLEFLKQHF